MRAPTRVKYISGRFRMPPGDALAIVDEGSKFTCADAFRVNGGEAVKRWDELQKILSWLAFQNAERSQTLLVIGGGATLDLGALAASLYRRGMPLTLVPTTLLGMVDATLGGKTAVDLDVDGRLLKNFAGTFYPAREVLVCPEFLSTLPLRERVSGTGEVLKTMWIRGGKWKRDALMSYVRSGKVGKDLLPIIKACLDTKAKIVARDPLDEKRIREVLNFGHTVGHALESMSTLSHGECVLWGMAAEANGKMRAECLRTIEELELKRPGELTSVSPEEWARIFAADKKMKKGNLEMSSLSAPGKIVKRKISPTMLARSLAEF